MPILEASVKSQFEMVFSQSDWRLFKKMAEVSFSDAAFLRKSTKVEQRMRLLVRNSRKRLLIGVGTELLVKAIYLKAGYSINKPKGPNSAGLKFPFKLTAVSGIPLDEADTYMLNQLIDHLKFIVTLNDLAVVTDGLKIAKVFRNKEGHVVTPTHKFVAESFRAIEAALKALYEVVFSERLTVRFSMERHEKAAWRTRPLA